MLGCPSAELSKTVIAKEKERVEKQAEELGEEGLKRKEEEIETAIAQNEVSGFGWRLVRLVRSPTLGPHVTT